MPFKTHKAKKKIIFFLQFYNVEKNSKIFYDSKEKIFIIEIKKFRPFSVPRKELEKLSLEKAFCLIGEIFLSSIRDLIEDFLFRIEDSSAGEYGISIEFHMPRKDKDKIILPLSVFYEGVMKTGYFDLSFKDFISFFLLEEEEKFINLCVKEIHSFFFSN